MKNTRRFYVVGLLVVAVSVLVACNKADKNTKNNDDASDTGYASDHALSEKIFDDVQILADKAAGNTASGEFKTTACGSVLKVTNLIIIDFGAANCMCVDGRNRRGKITIKFMGKYADTNLIHTITFENYFQDDIKVEGTKTVTYIGRNVAGQPYYNVSVAGTITKTDGSVITPNWSRVRTWVAGYNTPYNWTDDEYKIIGSGTIIRSSGVVNVAIVDTMPLMIATNCKWIKSGSIVYSLPGDRKRILNYGNTPACDNQATLTFLPAGTTIPITLP